MSTPTTPNRRSVLKTIGATAIGGSVLSSMASPVGAVPGKARGRRSIVEITARHDHSSDEHSFDFDTIEVPAGWTTFDFDNPTGHAHFVYLAKLPQQAIDDAAAEGMGLLEFYVDTVTGPFQWFMDSVFVPGKDPDPDDLSDVYSTLFPPWFGDLVPRGGPGLTSGGTASRTTVDLAAGEYIAECYVKDDNNDFHSYNGMIEILTVTGDTSGVSEPDSTLDLTISTSGINVDAEVRPGQHVVGIEFENQGAYANLVGHDVNLIRLDEDTDLTAVNDWMNWADVTGLVSDDSEPGRFMGGCQDLFGTLPEMAYFHVNLTPGDYAWVAEIPDPKSKNMLQSFTVPHGQSTGRSA